MGCGGRRAASWRVLAFGGCSGRLIAVVAGVVGWLDHALVAHGRHRAAARGRARAQGDRRAAGARAGGRHGARAAAAAVRRAGRRRADGRRRRARARSSWPPSRARTSSACARPSRDRRPARRRSPCAGRAPARARAGSLVAALTAGQVGVLCRCSPAACSSCRSSRRRRRGRGRAARARTRRASGCSRRVGLVVARLAAVGRSARCWPSPASRSRASPTGCASAAGCWRAARRRCRSPACSAVRVVEGTLRRPFGLATLRAEVIGLRARRRPPRRRSSRCCAARRWSRSSAALLPELADELDGLAPRRRAARCAATCCRPRSPRSRWRRRPPS